MFFSLNVSFSNFIPYRKSSVRSFSMTILLVIALLSSAPIVTSSSASFASLSELLMTSSSHLAAPSAPLFASSSSPFFSMSSIPLVASSSSDIVASSSVHLAAVSTDTCYQFSLSEKNSITSTCGNAVDYPFYLRNGTTLSSLEAAARLILTDQKFLFASSECLVNYKKLVCSNIYMKCQPGVVISDVSTYNHLIYPSYPVPLTRPCKQVCTEVVASCAGLFTPNCTADYDYSSGKKTPLPLKYDKSNNASLCNRVPAIFTVATSSEPYLHQKNGACAGIVTDVYIPPANLIDPTYTFLTPKYELQSIIESILVSHFAQIPVYTSEDCHFAFRKYFCGSYMLHAQDLTVATALRNMNINQSLYHINASLLSTTFFIPQYPSQSVCTDYASKCSVFLALANVTALMPNCNGKIPHTNIEKFSNITQVVNYVVLPLEYKNQSKSVYETIYLASQPYSYSSANDANYVTQCPEGFVVPDHPLDLRTINIPGSGCAFACRFPIWTVFEYQTFDLLLKCLSAFGLPMVLYFIVTSILDVKKRKTQYLRLFYASTALVLATVSLAFARDSAYFFCNDIAIFFIISHDGATACTVEGVLFFYGGWINGLAWMLLALDLYIKIVWGVKSTAHHIIPHWIIIYILPAIFTAAVTASGVEFGYVDASSAICSISTRGYKDLYFFYIPLFIFNFVGLGAGICVIYTIITSIDRSSSTTSWNKFNVIRTPLFFILMFVSLWSAAFAFRAIIFIDNDAILASALSWTICVFKTFDGTNISWQDKCGIAPPIRPSYTFNMFILTFIGGQGIIITLIFKFHAMYTFISKLYTSNILGREKSFINSKSFMGSKRKISTSLSSNMVMTSSFHITSMFRSSIYRKSRIIPTNRSTGNITSTRIMLSQKMENI